MSNSVALKTRAQEAKKEKIPCAHADIDKMSQKAKSKEKDHDQIPARGSHED